MYGGCSSMAEHLTVAQVVVGSSPIIRPKTPSSNSEFFLNPSNSILIFVVK